MLYVGLAAVWMVASDPLLATLLRDPEVLVRTGIFKNLAFIAISAALLYLLLRRAMRPIEEAFAAAHRNDAAQAAYQEECRRAVAIVESSDEAIMSKTLEGVITTWNPAAARMFGYETAEILGLSVEVLIPPDRPDEEPMILRRIKSGERINQFETVRRRKDGTLFPIAITFSPIWQPDETAGRSMAIVGVSTIARDITERKQSEAALSKSEERYRSTLDNILEGCQLFDFDWRYLYLNDAAARQNRRPNEELMGSTLLESWPGIEDTALFALLKRCMAQRVPLHEETEFLFPDGSTGWFDVRTQPAREGIFVLSIDISERKLAERELRELYRSLERKVKERTVDLDMARQRAEAADRVKSAFLATMSHELRTPLNSILGFTGLILQGLAGPLTAEQAKQLGMVQGSGRHLLALINDVLDISKIEAGQLSVHSVPFDVRASIDSVAASVTPTADKKGLRLRIVASGELGSMETDQRRFEQILLNLLNNGIKFTDHGEVTLSIDVRDRTDALTTSRRSMAHIQVTDTGIGIRDEDLARLFQPFVQIDSGLQRQHEGTGLGLAICHRLTELLGGTIGAESVLGSGSVFTVDLPMKMGAPS